MWDVFISYSRKDKDAVAEFKELLEKANISVWLDTDRVSAGENFTQCIAEQLPNCRGLIAWYSPDYRDSRACQWELTSAYLASQQKGNAWERILVINTENNHKHILLPSGLSGQVWISTQGDSKTEFRDGVYHWLSRIGSTFGPLATRVRPIWFGRSAEHAPHYLGRTLDMWKIDAQLNAGSDVMATGGDSIMSLQVRGIGGTGKSILASEYALRFGGTYPAGIFWLSAMAGDSSKGDKVELAVVLDRLLASFATQLRLQIDGMSTMEIKSAISQHFEAEAAMHQGVTPYRFLWIVDDFPSGQSEVIFEQWMAPNRFGRTIFTMRSCEYEHLGKAYDLSQLEDSAAYDLLTAREPGGALEVECAKEIVKNELGNHALAIVVASASIKCSPSKTPYSDYLDSLRRCVINRLENDAQSLAALPFGHERSIAATLRGSIDQLDPYGQRLLILSSLLASAPIPALLVIEVFRRMPVADEFTVEEYVAKAVINAVNLSLVSQEDNARPKYVVHSLVSRFVISATECQSHVPAIRVAAVDALCSIMESILAATTLTDMVETDLLIKHALHFSESLPLADGFRLKLPIASYFFKSGAYVVAEEIFSLLYDSIDSEIPKDCIFSVLDGYANCLHKRGKYDKAAKLRERISKIVTDAWGEDHLESLQSRINLARSYKEIRNPDRTFVIGGEIEVNWCARARAILERDKVRIYAEETMNIVVVDWMLTLASVLKATAEWIMAAKLQSDAIAYLKLKDGCGELVERDALAHALNELGDTLNRIGDYKEAINLFYEARAIREAIWGANHPSTLIIDNNIVHALLGIGNRIDLHSSKERLESAIAILERSLGNAHKQLIPFYYHLAIVKLRLGEVKSALKLMEFDRGLSKKLLGAEDGWTIQIEQQLSLMHHDKWFYWVTSSVRRMLRVN